MDEIYYLELEDGCFYVGLTRQSFSSRFVQHKEHARRYPNSWLGLHPPRTMHMITRCSVEDSGLEELRHTLQFMRSYGAHRVRGALWTNVEITRGTVRSILRCAAQVFHLCFQCGEPDHRAAQCTNPTHVASWLEVIADEASARELPSDDSDES